MGRKFWIKELEKVKMSIQWLIGNKHKTYGEVVSCGAIEGEPSRWLKGDIGKISIIPLSKLGENKVVQVIDVETKVIEIIADDMRMNSQDFKVHDDLVRKHGVNEFDFLSIQISLENYFKIKFPCELIDITNTVQQIIDCVEKQTKETVKKSTLDVYAKYESEDDGDITLYGLDNKKG